MKVKISNLQSPLSTTNSTSISSEFICLTADFFFFFFFYKIISIKHIRAEMMTSILKHKKTLSIIPYTGIWILFTHFYTCINIYVIVVLPHLHRQINESTVSISIRSYWAFSNMSHLFRKCLQHGDYNNSYNRFTKKNHFI
jgi:hypothetical protein